MRLRSNKGKDSWVECISWEPRAFIYHNFLSEKECSQLINLAKPCMGRSLVSDPKTWKGVVSSRRTSSGRFLAKGHNQLVRRIEKRIAEFTFIPVENGEGLSILHYEVGQKFEPHHDYYHPESFSFQRFGQRIATIVMYLSDVKEGGATVFPTAKKCASSARRWWKKLPEYGRDGLSVKPKMGDALLFWSMNPDGTLDPTSLHGSSPVIDGDKWVGVSRCKLKEFNSKGNRSTSISKVDDGKGEIHFCFSYIYIYNCFFLVLGDPTSDLLDEFRFYDI